MEKQFVIKDLESGKEVRFTFTEEFYDLIHSNPEAFKDGALLQVKCAFYVLMEGLGVKL